ncbi:MAG: endospore germination permease [Firmicutes bacterium]|nr:endospore germination permease [Bacillota bacterium]
MKPLEEGQISPRQLYALLVLSHLETTTSVLPSLTTAFAGRDSWLAIILAIIAVLPLGFLAAWLGTRFPRQTIVQYSSSLLGRPLGFLLSSLYIWFFMYITALVARESAVGFNLSVLPQTPPIVLIVILVLLAAITARSGIEVIGRLAESSFALVIFFTLLTLVLPLSFAHPEYLQPALARGVPRVLKAALIPLGLLGEFIAANMAIPYLTKPEKTSRTFLYTALTSGMIILFFTLVATAVFGRTAANLTIPPFKLARMISIGNFFERIEVIVLAVWTIVALIKASFYLWIGSLGIAQLFNLKSYRALAYPLGIITVVLSILAYENFAEAASFYVPQTWGVYSITIELGIILLLVIATLLRAKKINTLGKIPEN